MFWTCYILFIFTKGEYKYHSARQDLGHDSNLVFKFSFSFGLFLGGVDL